MIRRISALAAGALFLAGMAAAQTITLPPSGDNQKASVTQSIGLVTVTIDYSSPDVHGPSGEDRRGKIWGALVPWGLVDDPGYGTCRNCPWRAGANENTVFTVSHDVLVNGSKLPAGRYGLHMIPQQDEWTVIFSKDAEAWGSYFYDPAHDALRVQAKPAKNEYREWLTYEFTDRRSDRATVALMWEDLAVPFTIQVEDPVGLYLARIRAELTGEAAGNSDNFLAAARYALANNREPAQALDWANRAVNAPFVGRETFNTLATLAAAQEANGMTAEGAATRERSLNHPTATPVDLHGQARRLIAQNRPAEALAVAKAASKRFKTAWPVNVTMARSLSANGQYKEALRYARLALAQAPDELNRNALADGVAKLERGQDMNR